MEELNEEIRKLAQERIRFIRQHQEEFVEAWIAKTGLDPEESVMCIDSSSSTCVKIWIEKKSEQE